MFRPEVQCVSFHKLKLPLFTGGYEKGRTSVVVLPSHLVRPYSSPPMRITKLLLYFGAKIANISCPAKRYSSSS